MKHPVLNPILCEMVMGAEGRYPYYCSGRAIVFSEWKLQLNRNPWKEKLAKQHGHMLETLDKGVLYLLMLVFFIF